MLVADQMTALRQPPLLQTFPGSRVVVPSASQNPTSEGCVGQHQAGAQPLTLTMAMLRARRLTVGCSAGKWKTLDPKP